MTLRFAATPRSILAGLAISLVLGPGLAGALAVPAAPLDCASSDPLALAASLLARAAGGDLGFCALALHAAGVAPAAIGAEPRAADAGIPTMVVCDPTDTACAVAGYDNAGPPCDPENDDAFSSHGTVPYARVGNSASATAVGAFWWCYDSLTYFGPEGPTLHQSVVALFEAEYADAVEVDQRAIVWMWESVPAWEYERCFVMVEEDRVPVVFEDCPNGMRPPNPV